LRVALLVEHWGLLDWPLLYISLALKRHRDEYYRRLASVRSEGDWEGWLMFFLACVCEAAGDGVETAGKMAGSDAPGPRRHRETIPPASLSLLAAVWCEGIVAAEVSQMAGAEGGWRRLWKAVEAGISVGRKDLGACC
jgi:hypothetical protein